MNEMERVTLREMTAEEYARFRAYSIEHHAADLAGGAPSADARFRAAAEFDGLLPQGLSTPDNRLMTITEEGTRPVGYIWYLFEETDGVKQVFLADFVIDERERRKGFGAAALHEMEKAARESGCAEAVLWVYHDNTAAVRLYTKEGYRPFRGDAAGTYMKKPL